MLLLPVAVPLRAAVVCLQQQLIAVGAGKRDRVLGFFEELMLSEYQSAKV